MGVASSLSARAKGRLAAVFYLVNIFTGASALFVTGTWGTVAVLTATVAYLAVTRLFYDLFRPVGVRLSALVALPSLIGCVISIVTSLRLAAIPLAPLGFFGLYCLGIGYLSMRSTFVPRWIGFLMLVAGISWLTFFIPSLAHSLAPYNMAPGIIAEVTLTLWLLIVGIDPERWSRRAHDANVA